MKRKKTSRKTNQLTKHINKVEISNNLKKSKSYKLNNNSRNNIKTHPFLRFISERKIYLAASLFAFIIVVCIIGGAIGGTLKNKKSGSIPWLNLKDSTHIKPVVAADSSFAPYLDIGMLEHAVAGHYKTIRDFEQFGVKEITAAFLLQNPSNTTSPVSFWAGTISTQGNESEGKYINDQVADYESSGGHVILSFGGANGKPTWMYGGANKEDPKLIATDIQNQITRYNTKDLDFDIEGQAETATWANDYLGKALEIVVNDDPTVNITITLPTLPTGMDNNGKAAFEEIKKQITTKNIILNLNVMSMDFGGSFHNKTEDINIENSVSSVFGQYSKIYPLVNSDDLKKHFIDTPMIGVNDIPEEVFDFAVANKVFSWARENKFNNWRCWSATRDYPGKYGPAGSGITDQKNGDFCKLFSSSFSPAASENITGNFKIENYYVTQKELYITWDKDNTLKHEIVYDVYKDSKLIGSTSMDSYAYVFINIPTTDSSFSVIARNLGKTHVISNSLSVKFSTMSKSNLFAYPIVKFQTSSTYQGDHLIAYNGIVYKLNYYYSFGPKTNPTNVEKGVVTIMCNVSDLVANWNYSADAAAALNE